MNRQSLPFLLISGICCLGMIGCSMAVSITDFNGKMTVVRDLHVDKGRTVLLHDGNGVRTINFQEVKRLRLYAQTVKTFDRKLFCLCQIDFTDGTSIGSNDDMIGAVKAYISVTEYLCGYSQGGSFRIMLIDVARLEKIE